MLSKPGNKPVLELFSLKGKVALVTGGSRGIGLAVAEGMAEAGAHVAIAYQSSKASAESAAANIRSKYDVKCSAYQAEVSDAAAIETVVSKVVAEFGHLDIAVVNAGISADFDALECSPEQYRKLMTVNLDGAFYTAQAAARVFKKQGTGNIIFTTSMSAFIVNRPQLQSVYNASKAGLVHLAKSLSVEWIDFCRINCISPGYIITEMIDVLPEDWRRKWIADSPGGRFGETYELKGAYVFCASDASSFMTGANITIDGAYTLP